MWCKAYEVGSTGSDQGGSDGGGERRGGDAWSRWGIKQWGSCDMMGFPLHSPVWLGHRGRQWQQCLSWADLTTKGHTCSRLRTEGLLSRDICESIKSNLLQRESFLLFTGRRMQKRFCFCGFEQIENTQLLMWREIAATNALCNWLRSAELSDLTRQTQIFPHTHTHTHIQACSHPHHPAVVMGSQRASWERCGSLSPLFLFLFT